VLIDTYDTPQAEALLAAALERLRRRQDRRAEILVQAAGALGYIAAAIAIAAAIPWHRSLSVASVLLVLGVWLAVERVRFPTAGGWTRPTMLAFVPALFLLPTPIVPAIACVAVVLRRAPEVLTRRASPIVLGAYIGDAWFIVGPSLLISLTGTDRFGWSHWPIYAAAFGAQIALDLAWTLASVSVTDGTDRRTVLPLLAWVYLVDAALAPLGLLIAAAAAERPGLVLLALSPMAMLWLFARERKHRLDETVALSTAYRGTALLLGDIVEADDHYTGVHSRDVVDLSVAVARALGLSARQQRDVEFAALLHDVGKIRIPKDIINKPGPLDPDEWELVKRHPVDGEEMLELVGGTLATVGRIVRASHERFDGEGYPDGLAGEEIPVEARIICACDAYSAMTTDRPYRAALSPAQALAELRRCAGTQFDPRVVVALERVLGRRQSPSTVPAAILSGAAASI